MVLDARITTLLELSVLAWVRRFRSPPHDRIPVIHRTDRHMFLFPQVCAHCIFRLKLDPLSKQGGHQTNKRQTGPSDWLIG